MHILNAMAPNNLFGLESQDYNKSKVVAIPVPYDSTMSYGTGSRHGPSAIIEASRHLELYDNELGCDVSKIGIFTTEEVEPDMDSPEKTVQRIEKEVSIVLEDGKFPFLIGGEHTVALGGIFAASKHFENISIIHLDAHSDSRDSFMGSKYSHACIMARAREHSNMCTSIGVRSINEESAKSLGKEIIYMKDIRSSGMDSVFDRIKSRLTKNVYITVDLDVLDPSEMPSVGTPEPDGMHYSELVQLIKKITDGRNVVGADMTELSPIPGFRAPDYLAAKLAYKMVAFSRL